MRIDWALRYTRTGSNSHYTGYSHLGADRLQASVKNGHGGARAHQRKKNAYNELVHAVDAGQHLVVACGVFDLNAREDRKGKERARRW